MWKRRHSHLPEDIPAHAQTFHKHNEDNNRRGRQPPSSEIRRIFRISLHPETGNIGSVLKFLSMLLPEHQVQTAG